MFTSPRTIRWRSATAVAALAVLALLTACGGTAKAGGPRVASVPGRSTSPKASPAPGTTGSASVVDRQLRVGATQAEIDRAYAAYYACWSAAGVPSTTMKGHDGGPLLTWKMNPKKYQTAVDSCADKEPLNPPEENPATNPKYWDQLRDELRCDQAKGLHLKIVPGRPGLWADPDSQANFAKLRSKAAVQDKLDCEVAAYTKK